MNSISRWANWGISSPRAFSTRRWILFIRSTASVAPAGSAKNTPWANLTVSKNRSTGAPGSLPVKNNQSTAFMAANSAAPPAKNSRMASGLPQMRRVTGEDKVGWYMRCLSVVGDNDDGALFANGEYSLGRGAVTLVERRLTYLRKP